jgi:benzoylformate decarboxylase
MKVREATFAVMRQLGMTTIFGNPGSTEIPFLTDLPDDLQFVLALQEGSLVVSRPAARSPAAERRS